MVTARVVLKGPKTYTLGKMRWVRDVPRIIKGEDVVAEYKANGHFHVALLKTEMASSKPKKLKKRKVLGSKKKKRKKSKA